MIVDHIIAGAAYDDIGAAVAVDRVVGAAGADRIGGGIAQDGNRGGRAARVHIGEVGDSGRARHLIAGIGEIHVRACNHIDRIGRAGPAVNSDFGAVIIDRIHAGPANDHILASVAVDGRRAGTCADRVGPGGSHYRHGRRDNARIHVGEVLDVCRAGCRLIPRRKV